MTDNNHNDLRDTLLEFARVITTEQQWRDEGRAIWKDHLKNKTLSAERKKRLHERMVYGGRLKGQRVAEIRTAAKSAPRHVAAVLFRAATRLETGERDAPELLEEAAAALLDSERTPPDPKADSPKKIPVSERVLRAIKYVNDYNRKVAQGKANKVARNAILSMHLDKPVKSKAVENLDRQLRKYRHLIYGLADSKADS